VCALALSRNTRWLFEAAVPDGFGTQFNLLGGCFRLDVSTFEKHEDVSWTFKSPLIDMDMGAKV